MKRLTRVLSMALLLALAAPALANPVDINSADAATLAASLTGVGEARARAIVAYREQHGPFRRVEDLKQGRGIGDHVLQVNRDLLTVNAANPPRR